MNSIYIVSARSGDWPLSVYAIAASEVADYLEHDGRTVMYVPDAAALRNELKALVESMGFLLIESEDDVVILQKYEGDLRFQVNLYASGIGDVCAMRRVMEGEPDYAAGARWTTEGAPGHGHTISFMDEASLRDAMERLRLSILIGIPVV